MDRARIALMRDLLAGTGWVERTRSFGQALRRAPHEAGGLLLVGTPTEEPWHFAAHLDDEARWSDLPGLAPVLVRWSPPPDAPPHLAVGLRRLEQIARGETVFVVAPDAAPEQLLERVADARKDRRHRVRVGCWQHRARGSRPRESVGARSGERRHRGSGVRRGVSPCERGGGRVRRPRRRAASARSGDGWDAFSMRSAILMTPTQEPSETYENNKSEHAPTDDADVGRDPVPRVARKVTSDDNSRRPHGPTSEVPDQKRSVRHLRHAREARHERAQCCGEAADEDSATTKAHDQFLRAVDMLRA